MSWLCVSLPWLSPESSAAVTVCFGNTLRAPVLSTIFLPPCSLGTAPSPRVLPSSCSVPIDHGPLPGTLGLAQPCRVLLSFTLRVLWWQLSLPGLGRGTSCSSISRAAPHEVFIGVVMLFPCQTITEIGSVCVIGERILMAQFSLRE